MNIYKAQPFAFKTHEVQKILSGEKTQVRRILDTKEDWTLVL